MIHRAQPKHLLLVFSFLVSSLAIAQTPAAKPANATGQCKDGTYSTAASKSGACRGHNGVKDWYAAATPASPTTTVATPPPAPISTAKTPAPAATVKPVPAPPAPAAAAAQPPAKPAAKGPKANLANTPQAPGGGPGLVWVNTGTNVYHCPGTDFYGKTKAGSYLSEADAKAKGARPDHGNACTK